MYLFVNLGASLRPLFLFLFHYSDMLNLNTGVNVDVTVSLFIGDADEAAFVSTAALLSYAQPNITSLSHDDCEGQSEPENSKYLVNCPRAGQGTLTITGTDFGADFAVVLIGSNVCENVVHNRNHTELECVLPAGVTADNGVILIQNGGSMSRNQATVSYVQCQPGTFQPSDNITCRECPPGKISEVESQTKCVECSSSVDFQPFGGQQECYACPVDAVFADNHTSCVCRARYYAIPFGDDDTFKQLDSEGYEIYQQDFDADATTELDFNPYEYLGFWCVPCPEGADCSNDGTTLANVQAIANYFIGVDESGTAFFECLNNACLAEGDCATGYTGVGCTECNGDDLVFTDFECKKCPHLGLSILALLCGIMVVALYLRYKINSKRQGNPPSESSVFYKILMSTFQVTFDLTSLFKREYVIRIVCTPI